MDFSVITNKGKSQIKRYLGKESGTIGEAISVGIGPRIAAATEILMHFEVERVQVSSVSYDSFNDKILFKAELPSELDCSIHEIALWTDIDSGVSGVIADFNDDDWSAGALSSTNSRMGFGRLLTGAAGTAQSTTQAGVEVDLSTYLQDTIAIALHSTGQLSNILVTFISPSGNYLVSINPANDYGGTAPTNYYGVHTAPMSSYTTTGTPDASDITSITVQVTAAAGSALSVTLDAIRIEDAEIGLLDPGYLMVARSSSVTPLLIKEPGKVAEIEYRLGIS